MGHLGGLIVSFGACLLISHFKKWETVGVAFQKKWKWAWCTGSVLAIALIFVHEWPLYSFLIAIASLVASILTIGKWWGKISWKVWMGVTFLVFIVGVSNSTVNTKTGENLVTIIYIALFFGVMYLLMKNISNTGKKKK
jgi:hypothetical protein